MLQLQQNEETGPDLERLSKQLESKKAEEFTVAETQLQQLSLQQLIGLIGWEARARKKRQKKMIFVFAGYFAFMLALSIMTHHFGHVWMFTNMIGILAGAAAFKPSHKIAAKALAKYDDITTVGTLVEQLEIRDADVQAALYEALTRLFPRLRASDARLLNKEQRRILLKNLRIGLPTRNSETAVLFYVAALKALEQVGDETFLPLVEDLSEGRGASVYSPTIQKAAQECLPYLRQRAEFEHARHELLRASAPDHTQDAEVLLRPAEDRGVTRADELLRPDMVNHDEAETSVLKRSQNLINQ
jgi:hypothetical protein